MSGDTIRTMGEILEAIDKELSLAGWYLLPDLFFDPASTVRPNGYTIQPGAWAAGPVTGACMTLREQLTVRAYRVIDGRLDQVALRRDAYPERDRLLDVLQYLDFVVGSITGTVEVAPEGQTFVITMQLPVEYTRPAKR